MPVTISRPWTQNGRCVLVLLYFSTNTICDASAYPMAFTLGHFFQSIGRFFIWAHFSVLFIKLPPKCEASGWTKPPQGRTLTSKFLALQWGTSAELLFRTWLQMSWQKKWISLALHCNMICISLSRFMDLCAHSVFVYGVGPLVVLVSVA